MSKTFEYDLIKNELENHNIVVGKMYKVLTDTACYNINSLDYFNSKIETDVSTISTNALFLLLDVAEHHNIETEANPVSSFDYKILHNNKTSFISFDYKQGKHRKESLESFSNFFAEVQ